MSIRIRRFEPGDVPAIQRLNARLEDRGVHDRVYAESQSTPSEARGDAMSQELYVAADEQDIRGGVWLHEHLFFQHGEPFRAGWLKYPVAESLINREYGGVPGAMLVTMMRRQPEIMALGMGQRTAPFAQLLASLGWGIVDVPFYASAIRPARVMRYLPQVQRKPMVKTVAGILSRTGAANIGLLPKTVRRRLTLRSLMKGVEIHLENDFGAWADEAWSAARDDYGFIARRDAEMLNLFYRTYPGLKRLRVTRNGKDIGWVATTMADPKVPLASKEFGDLCVGLIADGMGKPENARYLLAAAVEYLSNNDADLVVTNQIHTAWREPLASLGFIQRPTNFFFGHSKKMTPRLGAEIESGGVFLNRGDCDGPPKWA